MNIHTRTSTID